MARLLAALLILATTAVAPVSAAEEFERGFHYLLLEKMQKQTVPAGKVEVLGESRTLTITNRQFSDDFRPYGVHLYRVTASKE